MIRLTLFLLTLFFSLGRAETINNWNTSYFLAPFHPAFPVLNQIFSIEGVLDNEDSLQKAGFTLFDNRSSGMKVASHPLLPGFLVKLFLNNQSSQLGSNWLFDRCKGAENVRSLIQSKKLKHFRVPRKWIYPLPGHSFEETDKQVAILLVERMPIVSKKDSGKAWKQAGKEVLNELFQILSAGYSSCGIRSNIPYSARYRAFICLDTEYPQRDLPLERVRDYLSPEMAAYWDSLLQERTNRAGR